VQPLLETLLAWYLHPTNMHAAYNIIFEKWKEFWPLHRDETPDVLAKAIYEFTNTIRKLRIADKSLPINVEVCWDELTLTAIVVFFYLDDAFAFDDLKRFFDALKLTDFSCDTLKAMLLSMDFEDTCAVKMSINPHRHIHQQGISRMYKIKNYKDWVDTQEFICE